MATTGKLAISPEAPRRFLVGLSWDPLPLEKRSLFQKMADTTLIRGFAGLFSDPTVKRDDAPGIDSASDFYDLDLACYVFDDKMALKHVINTQNDNFIDPSRKIYHSGEDYTGAGGHDDESVSVETSGIPDDYRNLFFVAQSDSRYGLEEMSNPSIRLADGKTNGNFLQNAIKPPAKNGKTISYVFCHVWREGDDWHYRHLDEYYLYDEDWEKLLPTLVSK